MRRLQPADEVLSELAVGELGPLGAPYDPAEVGRDRNGRAAKIEEVPSHKYGASTAIAPNVAYEAIPIVVEPGWNTCPTAIGIPEIDIVAALGFDRSVRDRLLGLKPRVLEVAVHSENLSNFHSIDQPEAFALPRVTNQPFAGLKLESHVARRAQCGRANAVEWVRRETGIIRDDMAADSHAGNRIKMWPSTQYASESDSPVNSAEVR